MKKEVILASHSPRRRELLEANGIEFLALTADIDETLDADKELPLALEDLAYRKAEAVFRTHPDALVIGSDTVVTLEGTVLGKPKDEEDAKRMLRSLSGRTHQVITAVCLLSDEKKECFHSITDVQFYDLSEEEIDRYVASSEPMDKAGAYGIQGKGCRLVKAIRGDYYTVVGFPIAEVLRRLDKEEN